RHVPPKPSPWQGPYRVTQTEFRAICNARNTGVVYSAGQYLVFVDDCAVLMPGWWSGLLTAARLGLVVGGARHKFVDMVVEDGVLASGSMSRRGRDSRWDGGSDAGLVAIGGGGLFGSTIGVPRSLFLAVNGFDEICETPSGEDCHLGFRLENAGAQVWFDRR